MIPGGILYAEGDIVLNEGAEAMRMEVASRGDRPVQCGNHYHFAETNPALDFDRAAAWGRGLDIAAGTAVHFETGQTRDITLIPFGGAGRIVDFRGEARDDR